MRRTPEAPGRAGALARYRANRVRTRALFDMVDPRFYETRPIPLRNPIVFYEGHVPAFALNTLVKRGLGRPGVNARLEQIFARGIDPADERSALARGGVSIWPARDTVRRFADACDEQVERALDDPASEGLEHVGTILEHEEMHQETLLYMLHRLPYRAKSRETAERTFGVRVGRTVPLSGSAGAAVPAERIHVPVGETILGRVRDGSAFGWDNEFESHELRVPAFVIDARNVTNAEYMEYVDEAGAGPSAFWERRDGAWYWRGQFEPIPFADAAGMPAYVTQAQAHGYARWRGARLPSEAEWHRALDVFPHPSPDAFSFDPRAVAAVRGRIADLTANGWEWTSTTFGPFPGFRPMISYPEYSADFFDGEHTVLKGASPVTPAPLVRRSFRNWFRRDYPYVYAAFRCVWTGD